jgi:hypothetical protein
MRIQRIAPWVSGSVEAATTEAKVIEAKIAEFGHGAAPNPTRTRVALLRAQREAGELDETEWAVKLAEVLGAVDPAPLAAQPTLVG